MRWLVAVALVGASLAYDCVVVGGGFGGLYTTLRLASSCPWARIALVEPRDAFCFSPLLYEYATGLVEASAVSARYEEVLPASVRWYRAAARGVDVAAKAVELDDGRTLDARSLALCAGREPVRVDGALSFATLDDARAVREATWDSALVVGGGYVGVELAAHLSRVRGARVTLAQRGPTILPKASAASRDRALAALADVDLRLNARVERRDGSFEIDGRVADADGVVWTAGRRPPALVATMPHPTPDGRLRVDAALRLRAAPRGVFAAGDLAAPPGKQPQPSAQATLQQAYVLAHNIEAYLTNNPSLKTFTYTHLGDLLALGPADAALDLLNGDLRLEGKPAALARRLVYAARMPTNDQRRRALSAFAPTLDPLV